MRRSIRSLLALSSVAALALTLASAPVFAADPPGNNGTVKVAQEGDIDGIPDNEPHQNCIFDVQFFGYDADPSYVATATIDLMTAAEDVLVATRTVDIGGDDNSGGGSWTGWDGHLVFDLNYNEVLTQYSDTANANQGFHLRLTVEASGSIGADTKAKTFWARCEVGSQPS